jgi:hypothetical protein
MFNPKRGYKGLLIFQLLTRWKFLGNRNIEMRKEEGKQEKGQLRKDQIQRIESWLTKPNDVMIKEMRKNHTPEE